MALHRSILRIGPHFLVEHSHPASGPIPQKPLASRHPPWASLSHTVIRANPAMDKPVPHGPTPVSSRREEIRADPSPLPPQHAASLRQAMISSAPPPMPAWLPPHWMRLPPFRLAPAAASEFQFLPAPYFLQVPLPSLRCVRRYWSHPSEPLNLRSKFQSHSRVPRLLESHRARRSSGKPSPVHETHLAGDRRCKALN